MRKNFGWGNWGQGLVVLLMLGLFTGCGGGGSGGVNTGGSIPAGLMGGSIQSVPLNLTTAVSTFSGGGWNVDAVGTSASLATFAAPVDITQDGTNFYVVDSDNHSIRKVNIASGGVTTLAGSGEAGYADGIGTAASFHNPRGITIVGGSLYVTDGINQSIRKIVIATGEVTTVAGTGISGSADGAGVTATFHFPVGITNDGSNLYVADGSNNKIRKIVIATGVVSTLAGSGAVGSADATGLAATFNYPMGIIRSSDFSSLYVADFYNHKIRRIDIATGAVTTVAGTGITGSADGAGVTATFNFPGRISTDGTNLYVADSGNHKIRQIVISNGAVTTLAGTGMVGVVDGAGFSALFNAPEGMIPLGGDLYVADTGNHKIRKIVTSSGVVSSVAGGLTATDGTGSSARFHDPYSITTDGSNLYVADTQNNRIRKIVIATGAATTLAGSGALGAADGMGAAASFTSPYGITTDGNNLFVADGSKKIRKVVIATGAVTTLAGSGVSGAADGIGAAASFSSLLYGITTDGSNLFVVDYSKIRKIEIATGVVTTFAGSNVSSSVDGIGVAATFNNPWGITSDGTSLYVADTNGSKIRRVVIATGAVTTLAGSGAMGNADGSGGTAAFTYPTGITCDGTNLYVTDRLSNRIRKIVIATGEVSTVAGSGNQGDMNGIGVAAKFNSPRGITTDGNSLYVADTLNALIRKIQ